MAKTTNKKAKNKISAAAKFPKIKDKIRRNEEFLKYKSSKNVSKLKEKKQYLKDLKHGLVLPKDKKVPNTLENQRVILNEELAHSSDDEIIQKEAVDEFQDYYQLNKQPKVLICISTDKRPTKAAIILECDLVETIPNSMTFRKRGITIDGLCLLATDNDCTDLIVICDDSQGPHALIICHLPNGPISTYKLSNHEPMYGIKQRAASITLKPEIIIKNFKTKLGRRVSRQLLSLFPQESNLESRQVLTIYNQRDYIFFRQHRYIFDSNKKVGLQEIGPRFTLKLLSIQNCCFEKSNTIYEWLREQQSLKWSRKKFFL